MDSTARDAVDEVLTTTRAVRRRLDLDRPVERGVVLDCLRLAMQAPTASNSQTWRWIVVTDPDTRAELARLYSESGRTYLETAAANEADPQTKRVYEGAVALTDTLARVPVHVIPCMTQRVDRAPPLLAASAYGSILPATWSFQLALRSRGLGSVFTTLHLAQEQAAAELLGIPFDRVTQVGLLPVAYTVGTEFRPAARPPVETVVHWDRWSVGDPTS